MSVEQEVSTGLDGPNSSAHTNSRLPAEPRLGGGEGGGREAAWWQTLIERPGCVLVATPAVLVQALVPGHVKVNCSEPS